MLSSHSIITNNIICGNSCFGGEGEGGGIKCWMNDKSIIINNTIANNSADMAVAFVAILIPMPFL